MLHRVRPTTASLGRERHLLPPVLPRVTLQSTSNATSACVEGNNLRNGTEAHDAVGGRASEGPSGLSTGKGRGRNSTARCCSTPRIDAGCSVLSDSSPERATPPLTDQCTWSFIAVWRGTVYFRRRGSESNRFWCLQPHPSVESQLSQPQALRLTGNEPARKMGLFHWSCQVCVYSRITRQQASNGSSEPPLLALLLALHQALIAPVADVTRVGIPSGGFAEFACATPLSPVPARRNRAIC